MLAYEYVDPLFDVYNYMFFIYVTLKKLHIIAKFKNIVE